MNAVGELKCAKFSESYRIFKSLKSTIFKVISYFPLLPRFFKSQIKLIM
jgi:hypothetical protein